jgi:hypothetical protein
MGRVLFENPAHPAALCPEVRHTGKPTTARPKPQPQLQEVIASGPPVEEVIARLTAVQAAPRSPGTPARSRWLGAPVGFPSGAAG